MHLKGKPMINLILNLCLKLYYTTRKPLFVVYLIVSVLAINYVVMDVMGYLS